jgi:Flp pilus assembly protein TadG
MVQQDQPQKRGLRVTKNNNAAKLKFRPNACSAFLRRHCGRAARGQAMVEFALIATVAIIVLVIGIQFALIGQAALAVSQLSFAGARYASVNTSYTNDQIKSYMLQVGSPTITANSGANLTIAVSRSTDAQGNYFGQPVTVNITYNASDRLILPNPFLGITFPTSLTAQETAMQE